MRNVLGDEMPADPKPDKPIRLQGKKKHDLYMEVWFRDKGCCVGCGKWVEPGTPPHHIKKKSQGGGDTEDNLVTICMECHSKHH